MLFSKLDLYLFCHTVTLYQIFMLLFTAKNGPVYSVEWHPDGKEFCVVFGCILSLLTVTTYSN